MIWMMCGKARNSTGRVRVIAYLQRYKIGLSVKFKNVDIDGYVIFMISMLS